MCLTHHKHNKWLILDSPPAQQVTDTWLTTSTTSDWYLTHYHVLDSPQAQQVTYITHYIVHDSVAYVIRSHYMVDKERQVKTNR